MARKQLTAISTAEEKKIAYDQLRAAQEEYASTLQQWPKDTRGNLIDPRNNKILTLSDYSTIMSNIAEKYDYVDVGSPPQPAQVPGEPLQVVVQSDEFYVDSIGQNTKVDFTPTATNTAPVDDGYRASRPVLAVPSSSPGQPGSNPQAAKIDQSSSFETTPQTATDPKDVSREITTPAASQREAEQAGQAVANQQSMQQANNGTGVIENNPNSPLSNTQAAGQNNFPSYFTGPGGNIDDTGRFSRPAGMSFNGTGETNNITVSPDAGKEGAGGLTTGTTSAVPASPQMGGSKNNPQVPVTPNVLHNYVNWTYKISFYMIDVSAYNGIIDGGDPSRSGLYPVAVSGGYARGAASGNLEGDIYIDSLRFTSVIGNRQAGSATNNLDLEMQLFEPYGASLLGQLAERAKQLNPNLNLSEVPYLVEIDFTGYKDDGTPVTSILGEEKRGKKYIPVKVLSVDMKIEAAGAKYTFSMSPYSMFAYTLRYGSIPKEVWVYGETVEEILGNNSQGLIGRLNAIEKEKVEKDKTQEFPDVYDIKFYSFNKQGTNTNQLGISKVAYPTDSGPATIIHARKIDENKPTKQGYTIRADTVVKDAIKALVLASEYFNQKMTPDAPNSSTEPAELLKVIPVIKLQNKWDSIRNEFPKEITYHVTNTLLFGELYSYGGQAPIETWGYPKVYNYIFTGKNDDVLDVDLTFNALYYQKFFPDLKENSVIKTNAISKTDKAPANSNAGQGIASMSTKAAPIQSSAPNESSRYINSQLAAEFFDLKMNNSNADLVNLDLNIIGDPDWIPQDASVRGGKIVVADQERRDAKGSIAVDVAGVYVKLQLRTPRDYNDASGLMDLQLDKTLVGGVYQVITVENQFQGGKYNCTLNLVKIPKQEENKLTPQQNFNRDRQASAAEVAALQSASQSPAVSTGTTANPPARTTFGGPR